MSDTTIITTDLIRAHLRSNYRPCDTYSKADIRLNTAELYEKLITIFPVTDLTQDNLFKLMLDEGFSYSDSGDLIIEWLLTRCLPIDG
jgi:hypothetical protein